LKILFLREFSGKRESVSAGFARKFLCEFFRNHGASWNVDELRKLDFMHKSDRTRPMSPDVDEFRKAEIYEKHKRAGVGALDV
jgi:hypothetical protein